MRSSPSAVHVDDLRSVAVVGTADAALVTTVSGPAVGTSEPPFEAMNLERLKPNYVTYPPVLKTLRTPTDPCNKHRTANPVYTANGPTCGVCGKELHESLPDPITVSPNDPQVIDLLEQTPGFEPDLGFLYFVRGAATLSLLTDPVYHEAIKETLVEVGTSVLDGKGLPELDRAFASDVNMVLKTIFNNGEPTSWRSLIAFTTGVFWLLSFLEDSDRKRGKMTPREWAIRLCNFWASLQYVPTSQ